MAMLDVVIESVHTVASEADLLEALGPVESHGRAIILIGGADATEPARRDELLGFLAVVARHCERTVTAIIDGGTDSGVMRLIGEARAALGGGGSGATFPLIGVVPAGVFERPTKDGEEIRPAPHHSKILRVPGNWFGDETKWLFAAADHLGSGSASTIVVNGGALTLREAHERLEAGHQVIAVVGSGRAADELAADAALRASGRLRVMHLTIDDVALAEALGR